VKGSVTKACLGDLGENGNGNGSMWTDSASYFEQGLGKLQLIFLGGREAR